MATMSLEDYFHVRGLNTLEVISNMEALFGDLSDRVEHAELRGLIGQQHQALQMEKDNLTRMVERFATPKPRRRASAGAPGETRMVIVGRGWIGVMETHREFFAEVPQQLVDVNAALLMEEVVHFNMGNYTGLIVLAKQLGDMDAADLLQQNIDREMMMRQDIESRLWEIIGNLQTGIRKAA
jgi:ferritin-like metal-binding protein YciE